MISNAVEVGINKRANILPVLLDYKDSMITWAEAVTNLNATCQWVNLDNADGFGVFDIDQDGRAIFTPSSVGEFWVTCIIEIDDFNTQDRIQKSQVLTITIVDNVCECDPEVSPLPDNRLRKLSDSSLYAPELQIDLNTIYAESKNEILPGVSNALTSEEILSDFVVAVGEDVQQIKSAIDDIKTIKLPSGQTMSALKGVYELNGFIRILDYRDAQHAEFFIGVTTKAVEAGNMATVQTAGSMEDSFWNFNVGRVWLGENGALTQVPPVIGHDILVGTAVSPTKLVLKIQDHIVLE